MSADDETPPPVEGQVVTIAPGVTAVVQPSQTQHPVVSDAERKAQAKRDREKAADSKLVAFKKHPSETIEATTGKVIVPLEPNPAGTRNFKPPRADDE